MIGMNVFKASAFETTSLTTAFENIEYKPSLLTSLGIFQPRPSFTRSIAIERRNGALAIIPTSPIGSAPKELDNDKRDIRDFRTVRLAKSFTMYAEEVNGIREFGTMDRLMQVQAEVARRGKRVLDDLEVTNERLMLGALQGIVKDADDSVLVNWFDEWGISAPAAVNFALTTDATKVRLKCHEVIRGMQKASGGQITESTPIHALCGDNFYDKLVTHPEVEKTYLNWQAAADLRENVSYGSFRFGGITFHNYRGTDDGAKIAIPTDEAKFFPVGTEIFQKALGPAEFEPWVNAAGQEMYALSIPDRDRNAWQKFEVYSYPLFICTRPDALFKAIKA
jgi:hypothetical protein